MSRAAPLGGGAGLPAGVPHGAMEQAAQWYALLRSGEASGRDHTRWRAWLERDPGHRQAWSYVESVSRSFEPIQATADPRLTADGLWAARQRVARRRRLLAGLAALAGTGLLGWPLWRQAPLPRVVLAWRADHRSAVGEIRQVVLADGSRVWLNTASAFDVADTAGERRLVLLAGEVFIETAASPGRPFVVETPQGRLTALGTRFTVRLEADATLLAVYEGAVEAAAEGLAPRIVGAGWQLRVGPGAPPALVPAEPGREAWHRGVLVAQDLPLAEVIAELRRHRRGHLGLAPELAGMRVFGSFPLHDTDAALELLAYALPLRIQRTLPWWVSIEPARGESG